MKILDLIKSLKWRFLYSFGIATTLFGIVLNRFGEYYSGYYTKFIFIGLFLALFGLGTTMYALHRWADKKPKFMTTYMNAIMISALWIIPMWGIKLTFTHTNIFYYLLTVVSIMMIFIVESKLYFNKDNYLDYCKKMEDE